MKGVIRAAILLLCFVCLAEVAFRAWITSPNYLKNGGKLFGERRPNSPVAQSTEGFCNERTNSLGLLDEELPPGHHPDILFMGDSYTEALQVERDQRFSSLIGKETELSTLNSGHSGWSWADYLLYLESNFERFQPKIVVVMVNDTDLSKDLFNQSGNHLSAKDGKWTTKAVPSPPSTNKVKLFFREITARSALANHSWNRLGTLKMVLSQGKAPPDPGAENLDLDAAELALMYWSKEVVKHPCRVIVCYVPRFIYQKDEALVRSPKLRSLYQKVFTEEGIEYLDITPMLQADYKEAKQALHGFNNSKIFYGHTNARAHKIIAKALSEVIQDKASRLD